MQIASPAKLTRSSPAFWHSIRARLDVVKSFSSPPRIIPLRETATLQPTPSPLARWPPWAGKSESLVSVNAGARLDPRPLSAIHRRILTLIAIGMFFDGYDVYVAATVLGATLKSGFS